MPISEILNNDEKYFAHKKSHSEQSEKSIEAQRDGVSDKPETIEEHSSLVLSYAKKIIKVKNLKSVIQKIGEQFFPPNSNDYNLWEQMFFDAIYLHDIGKANTDFQSIKMKNSLFKESQNKKPEHSLSSASIYFSKYYNLITARSAKRNFLPFLLINSYIISRHHGYLNNFEKFLKKFYDRSKFYDTYSHLLKDITVNFDIMKKIDNLNTLKM